MASIDNYEKVLVFQTVGELEDSYDFEGMTEHKKSFIKIITKAREMFEAEGVKALVLGVGGCGICEKCAKSDNGPCRFPTKAISSLEAYGVNVYELSKSADMKYINGQNTVTYFSAVFF
jgi:predicted metal-binding protein